MYAKGIESIDIAGVDQPLLDRRVELRVVVEVFDSEQFFPGILTERLAKEIGVEVIDAEAEECVAIRGDDPPAVILFCSEEAGGFEFFACPTAVVVTVIGGSKKRIGTDQSGTAESGGKGLGEMSAIHGRRLK